jgi:glycosyltransferase involved in cell wall biosynthesis
MPKVIWYFRKKRELGNFSIENSFRELYPHFADTEWEVEWREASWFSEGLLNRLRIAWEARQLKADIIHITGDINFAAILLWGRKVVLTVHDNGFLNDYSGWKRWVMKKVWLEWPLRRCARVVAVSQATKRSILEHTRYPESRIVVIPTVVPSHFRPRTALPQNPKPVLLHIGLAANKNLRGHALAIQGLDVKLRIIGEPSPADHAMLRGLGIDYEWLSRLSDEQMQEAYATSDLLLFCSTLEGFGMPILEAKAVGLPVITSNIEPMSEVGAGYAHLVDPSKPQAIRTGIQEVLKFARGSTAVPLEDARAALNKEVASSHCYLYGECKDV